MSEEEQSGLLAIVKGRVQGVGFRAFVHRQATALELTGFVRNRWDNTVEVLAEGYLAQLEKMQAALERGPTGSNVTAVETTWIPATGKFTDFEVKYTFG
jgi:acylphosphatase